MGLSASVSAGDVVLAVTDARGVTAQKPITIPKVELKEVSFSGTKYHAIKEDDGSANYDAPHWQDNSSPLDGDADDSGDKKFPISFTRNTKMKVSAKFKVTPASIPGAQFKVRGDGPGNLDIPATTATLSGGELTISNVECSNPFANTIDFLNPMEIAWEVSFDNGTTWCKAGTSKNRVYVTLENPKANSLYETLLDIGCRNAKGKVNPNTAVTAIWADFQSPIPGVKRKAVDGHNVTDGVAMRYWVELTDPLLNTAGASCQTIEAMINPSPSIAGLNGVGTCVAWADLFDQTVKAQGIVGSQVSEITPKKKKDLEFLVKKWEFGKHIRTGPNGLRNSSLSRDDIPICGIGNGFPNTICIKPGKNKVLNSSLSGDDTISGSSILTGSNGRCETAAASDDVQVIPVGQGEPDRPCIVPGPNGKLDSPLSVDDTEQDGLFLKITKDYPYLVFTIIPGIGKDIGDAANQPGVPGQGVSEPPPIFQNHFIIKFGNKVYDPSYGIGPFTEEEHENAACDGFDAIIGELVARKQDPLKKELKYDP